MSVPRELRIDGRWLGLICVSCQNEDLALASIQLSWATVPHALRFLYGGRTNQVVNATIAGQAVRKRYYYRSLYLVNTMMPLRKEIFH